MSLFGKTALTGGLFGQSDSSVGKGAFGSTGNAAPSSIFGTSNAGTSIFGASPTTSAAGLGGGLFSTTSVTQGQTPLAGGVLGGSTGGGLFGNLPAATTGSSFGLGASVLSSSQPSGQPSTAWLESIPLEVRLPLTRIGNPTPRAAQQLQAVHDKLKNTALTCLPEVALCPDFITFTYDRESSAQANAENQAQCDGFFADKSDHVRNLLEEAKKRNPDPIWMHTVPLIGMEQLLKRIEVQEKQFELCQAAIKELYTRQEETRRQLQTGTFPKCDDIRNRHAQLQKRLISVVGKIENVAKQNRTAQVDMSFMNKLLDDFNVLTNELLNGPSGPSVLARLRLEMHQFIESIHSGVPAFKPETDAANVMQDGVLNKKAMDDTIAILEQKQEFYDTLAQILRDDTNSIASLHQTIAALDAGRPEVKTTT